MNGLRQIKRALLATNGFGLAPVIARSNWRRQRLLILCYHGIAMGEEHGSHPEMFLPPAMFARRMEILAQSGCRVLDLGEALRLLQKGQLPAGSVAITFDDGWADFPLYAFPTLQKHGFPATVDLTTYYCLLSRPLFRFALAHMMWKLQSKVIENRSFPWLPEQLNLRTEADRTLFLWKIDDYAKQQGRDFLPHRLSHATANRLDQRARRHQARSPAMGHGPEGLHLHRRPVRTAISCARCWEPRSVRLLAEQLPVLESGRPGKLRQAPLQRGNGQGEGREDTGGAD